MTRKAAFLLLLLSLTAFAREPLLAKGSWPLWERPMSTYLKSHEIPPAVVNAKGTVKDSLGSVGFSAAVMPLLASLNEKAALEKQRRRLDSERNARTGLYGNNARYYDQNLALFATGWLEGRFRFDERGLLQVSWK